jgi:hypothetical protein
VTIIIRLIKHKKVILSKLFLHVHVALNESKRIRFTTSVHHIIHTGDSKAHEAIHYIYSTGSLRETNIKSGRLVDSPLRDEAAAQRLAAPVAVTWPCMSHCGLKAGMSCSMARGTTHHLPNQRAGRGEVLLLHRSNPRVHRPNPRPQCHAADAPLLSLLRVTNQRMAATSTPRTPSRGGTPKP